MTKKPKCALSRIGALPNIDLKRNLRMRYWNISCRRCRLRRNGREAIASRCSMIYGRETDNAKAQRYPASYYYFILIPGDVSKNERMKKKKIEFRLNVFVYIILYTGRVITIISCRYETRNRDGKSCARKAYHRTTAIIREKWEREEKKKKKLSSCVFKSLQFSPRCSLFI